MGSETEKIVLDKATGMGAHGRRETIEATRWVSPETVAHQKRRPLSELPELRLDLCVASSY